VFDPSFLTALVRVLRLALQPTQNSTRTMKMAIMALSVRNLDTFALFAQTAGESYIASSMTAISLQFFYGIVDQCLVLEDIHFQVDDTMFLGMLEDSKENIKILKITLR
jgi:hypothetical protein